MPDITLPGGATIPIPKWAIQGFGIIAVVAIAFGVYRHFYPIEPELVSVQQANHLLRLEVQEYNKHIVDTPQVVLNDTDKSIHVVAYDDGCLIVSRRFAGMSTTRLLLDPSREDIEHRAGDETASLPFVEQPVYAAEAADPKCLNPHPGKFTWEYGEKDHYDACWVQVIRTFNDTCQHVQMFNTCANTWATNRDGTPQVRWLRCIH